MKTQIRSTVQFLALMAVITVLAMIMTSCIDETRHLEKVVIIDEMPNRYIDTYEYKVTRIEHGVVTHINTEKRFDVGDTLYYKFLNTDMPTKSTPPQPDYKVFYEYNIYNGVDTIPVDTILMRVK